MRYISVCSLLAGMIGAGVAQPARTPDGMLWAGTTFSLRATAAIGNQVVRLSNEANVSVGAVIQWRVVQESSPAQTLPGSEGWFTLLLTNRSNAVDALNLRLKSDESDDTTPWGFAMFEQRADGSEYNNGSSITEATSVFMPGETRRLFIRANPPGNRNTDGALLNWVGSSRRRPSLFFQRGFAVGVEASQWAHTSATTPSNHQIIGEPVLIQGRLYWLTWDRYLLRLYRTPNPLNVSTTFSNNITLEARIHMPAPTHSTLLIGDRWYLLTQSGRLLFFSLSQAQGATTIAAQEVTLPEGVSPNPNLPLIPVGNYLGFTDRQNRLWLVHLISHTIMQVPSLSTQSVTVLSPLQDSFFAVGRSDGRVDVYRDAFPVVQGLRVPGAANQPTRFIRLYDSLMAVVAGNTIGIYRFDTAKWLWSYPLDSPAVAPPICDMRTGRCYVLTESGLLYGIELWRGALAPLYPQPIFSAVGVSRATLGCVARSDRGVSYLYLQAQLNDGTVRTMFITAHNPLNRFVFPTTLTNTPIGTRWLFTETTSKGLAINWVSSGAGSDATRGAFYGFLLR